MKQKVLFSSKRLLTVALLLFFHALLPSSSVTSVLAYSTDRSNTSPCTGDVQAPGAKSDPFSVQVMEPGEAPLDANWPVIHKETKVEKDASGQDVVTTTTIRRNPHPKPPKTTDAVSWLAAENYCTFLYDDSEETTVTRPAAGGLTQILKTYYHLYSFTAATPAPYAYHTYRTEISWTRLNSSYTLGQPSIRWFFRGNDCSNYGVENSNTNQPFTPVWFNGGNYTGIYTITGIDAWSTRTPLGGVMYTSAVTPWYRNGTRTTPDLDTYIEYFPY